MPEMHTPILNDLGLSDNLITILILIQIESDDDVLWKADVRETKDEVAARGMNFMNW